ncbi:MAG: discoidin domain-containing protein, partial [Verrucomicrobia bacterium]|nr:discoidin domain-containing protein [Verrucomicrobiota bacterium]
MNILGCVSNVALLSCLLIFADARVSAAQSMRARIEADWLRQAEAWWPRPAPTQADAAGAVDGVKDGKYAFHTGQDANPWWQVDLGEAQPITRIVVFNRLDYAPGLHNADNLLILVSDDAKQWRQIYDNQGKHFDGVLGVPAFADEAADKSKRVETSPDLPPKGGTTNPPPLEVKFKDGEVRTRYVRLQIPSDKPIFFHLDEVEIYGPADPAKNLALRQPADQSSVSQWSTSKISGPKLAAAVTPEVIRHFVERGRLLAAELKQVGVETMAFEREFDDVAMRLASISEIRNPRSEIRSASGDSAIRNSAGAGTAIGHAGLSTSSPSPRPSPAGRGSRGSQPGEQTGSLGSVQSLTAGLPLPAGEGRGEG